MSAVHVQPVKIDSKGTVVHSILPRLTPSIYLFWQTEVRPVICYSDIDADYTRR